MNDNTIDSWAYKYKAKLDRVIDGDTCSLHVDLGFGIWRTMTVRMYGYNTPDLPDREGKQRATNALGQKIQNVPLVLHTLRDRADKYGGRYLGIVWVSTRNINDEMVKDGYGKPYFGVGEKPL